MGYLKFFHYALMKYDATVNMLYFLFILFYFCFTFIVRKKNVL